MQTCDLDASNTIDSGEVKCAIAELAEELNAKTGNDSVPRYYPAKTTVIDTDKTREQNCDRNGDNKINNRNDALAGKISRDDLRSEIYCASDYMVAMQDRKNAE